MGIDMEINSNRIFALYSRLDTSYEGKGLGLYMTKTQIESLSGTITANSTKGIGTTFTITLYQSIISKYYWVLPYHINR
jgi:signal transduction histidine kinase